MLGDGKADDAAPHDDDPFAAQVFPRLIEYPKRIIASRLLKHPPSSFSTLEPAEKSFESPRPLAKRERMLQGNFTKGTQKNGYLDFYLGVFVVLGGHGALRSEEHTSELQS